MQKSHLQSAFETVYNTVNGLDESNQTTVVKDLIEKIVIKRKEKIEALENEKEILINQLRKLEEELENELKEQNKFIANVELAANI